MESLIMKKFILFFTFIISFSVFAQSPQDLVKLSEGMKLDKDQVGNMIEMMVNMGKISREDADKAKKELEKYSDDDMKALQHQAVEKIKNQKGHDGKGLGINMPSKGEQLAAPIVNTKSPASTDSPSSSSPKKILKSSDDPGYKEALDYLNQ